jgi:uncharacterized protein
LPPCDLLDVNVWLALAAADHPHHERARDYLREQSGPEVAFCRITVLGLVRHLTNPAVMRHAALPSHLAWERYQEWRRLPGVTLLAEPEGVEAALQAVLRTHRCGPRGVTDAYLAAFAESARCRLVSFDGGFSRFHGLNYFHLTQEGTQHGDQ